MIQISSDDLKKFKSKGSGTFGTVYQIDDKVAYKIYHRMIVNDMGRENENPCLYLSKRRYNRLIERSKKLSFTGGVLDLVYVDKLFRGVAIPYFEGERGSDSYKTEPMSIRIDLAKQFLNKSRELTDNLIYPTDYKLNNIIVDDDKNLHIVDLDDTRTHPTLFQNPVLSALTVSGLNECIWTLLHEYDHCYVSKKVQKELTRPRWHHTYQYHKIKEYLEEMSKKRTIVFMDDNTDLDAISIIGDLPNFHYVYVVNYDGPDNMDDIYYLSRIQKCREHNIPLYDFVKRKDMDKYNQLVVENHELEIDKTYVKTRK